MPHFNKDNILVVTKDEVLTARDESGNPFFNSWNHLKVTLRRYKTKTCGIKCVGRGGGKGNIVTILFDSLPTELQDAIGDPRKGEHPILPFFRIEQDVVDYFNHYRSRLGELEDEKKQRYITSASLLNAALKLMDERRAMWQSMGKHTTRGLETSICNDLLSFRPILKRKFQREYTLPENLVRLRERLRDYAGLKGEYRYEYLINGNMGNQWASVKTQKQMDLLESMFMSQKHKPTPTEVARQYDGFLDGYVEIINTETGEVYDPKEYTKLSMRTITAYLDSWHSKIATYSKRNGNRQKFMGEFIPGASLLLPEYAGSIISVDDRNPPFWYAKGKRIWFYCAYDVGAQVFTAWVYGKTKEGIILDFYREILRNYTEWGIPLPAEIECESSLNSTFRNTMLSDGGMFQYVRMEANKARGKYIERVWGKLRYEVEKSHEGWLARPNALRESNQKSNEDLPIIPYDELAYQGLMDIQNWNNSAHPDQKKYPGMTRWEVFMEYQNPDLNREINWKMILPYIGYKTETSCKAGTIKLNRKEFFLGLDGKISRGEELISLLELVEGRELDICWLDNHDGEVIKAMVYLRGGERIICEAILKPRFHRAKIEQTAQDRINMETVMAYINTFNGFISRRKAEIDKVMVIDHRTATLNNKFVIRGINTNRYDADRDSMEEAEVLTDMEELVEEQDTGDWKTPEVLNDVQKPLESTSNPLPNKCKRSLLNQFVG